MAAAEEEVQKEAGEVTPLKEHGTQLGSFPLSDGNVDLAVGDFVKVEVTMGKKETSAKFVNAIVLDEHEQGGLNIHIPGRNVAYNMHIYGVNEEADNVPLKLISLSAIPENLTINSEGCQATRVNGTYSREKDENGKFIDYDGRPKWVNTCDDGAKVALALVIFSGKRSWLITRDSNLGADGGYAVCAWDMWVPCESVPRGECWGIWDKVNGNAWIEDKTLTIFL